MLNILVLSALAAITCGQILIIPETSVDEPFKNNPVWEDFKTAQMDRIKVLKTLVDNVWSFLDGLENDIDVKDAQITFVDYHVKAFKEFFRDSERRLAEGNPYAVMEPAIHIHSIDTLLKLSEMPPNHELDRMRLNWMEVDAMALRVHAAYNETMTTISGQDGLGQVSMLEDQTFPTWTSGAKGGEMGQMTLTQIVESVNDHMERAENGSHMIRGLVRLLHAMDHAHFSKMSKLNHYCYGNNEFGVFQDMYHVVTDTALYLCMMNMKKLVLDVLAFADARLQKRGSKDKTEEDSKEMFQRMQQGIHKIVGFEYREGSDYTDLPHAPIFKCDLAPLEGGKTGQWGKNSKTGLSPKAGPTHTFDPQAGPEPENSTIYGYIDERTGQHQFVSFYDAFYGYLESELVLNPASVCKGTCPDYRRLTPTCNVPGKNCDKLRATHCDASEPGCMSQTSCPGYAKNCVRTSQAVQMCHAGEGMPGVTHYNFPPLRSMGAGVNMTGPAHCPGQMSTAKERWQMEFEVIMRTPQYCELCHCTCMTPKTKHFVSLEPQFANVKDGFIVTGVRFDQSDNVLSLQIEQGKPRLNGEVDESTVEWVPVSAPSSDEAKVPLGVGVDGGFHRMNFDLLVGSVDEVITGVQFNFNPEDQSVSLKIQVATLLKDKTGNNTVEISQESLKWISPPKRDTHRRPLELVHPADPTKQPGPSMPDVLAHSYVEFTVTDYFADLGKLTVPFFDTQPVHNYQVRRWLQGLGLMHKGKPGFGGFISPMVVPSKGKGCRES